MKNESEFTTFNFSFINTNHCSLSTVFFLLITNHFPGSFDSGFRPSLRMTPRTSYCLLSSSY